MVWHRGVLSGLSEGAGEVAGIDTDDGLARADDELELAHCLRHVADLEKCTVERKRPYYDGSVEV